MALQNPAFNNAAFATGGAKAAQISSQQLDELYNRPAATPNETERMTYDDVIMKTLATLGVLMIGATVGFFFPFLYLPFLFVGLGLGLVNSFKKVPSPALVLAFGAAQGIFVGGLSRVVENFQGGIIVQALTATAAVFIVTLALFASGKVRASKKATKIFMIVVGAYALFSIINLGMQLTGINQDPWGLYTSTIAGIPLGLILGPLVILLAAYSLVLDFDYVQRGVAAGAPRLMSWRAAFGLVLTIVWLYVELLRFLSILRGD